MLTPLSGQAKCQVDRRESVSVPVEAGFRLTADAVLRTTADLHLVAGTSVVVEKSTAAFLAVAVDSGWGAVDSALDAAESSSAVNPETVAACSSAVEG